jgi:hypothetical protein
MDSERAASEVLVDHRQTVARVISGEWLQTESVIGHNRAILRASESRQFLQKVWIHCGEIDPQYEEPGVYTAPKQGSECAERPLPFDFIDNHWVRTYPAHAVCGSRDDHLGCPCLLQNPELPFPKRYAIELQFCLIAPHAPRTPTHQQRRSEGQVRSCRHGVRTGG